MRHSEKLMPLAAVLSALSSLACCLPLGIAAAVGTGGLAVAFAFLRPWLLVLSGCFLGIGILQLYRSRRTCQRRSRTTIALFWIAAAGVLALIVFPQTVASILADSLP